MVIMLFGCSREFLLTSLLLLTCSCGWRLKLYGRLRGNEKMFSLPHPQHDTLTTNRTLCSFAIFLHLRKPLFFTCDLLNKRQTRKRGTSSINIDKGVYCFLLTPSLLIWMWSASIQWPSTMCTLPRYTFLHIHIHYHCLRTAQRPMVCGTSTLLSETSNVRTGNMFAHRERVFYPRRAS